MNPRFYHQSLGVHQDVTLTSFDLFGPYSIAALFASHARGLDRLGIHYGRARLGIPLEADPHALTKGSVHPFPEPAQAPSSEVVVDGLPRRSKSCGSSRQAQPLLRT